MLTLASMRSLVRTLTAVSATDILTDALLNQLLNESLFEIYRRQGTGWPFAQTALSTDDATPPFDAQFHMAVVYRTSAKVLMFIADTTPRGQVFTEEYIALLSDMEKYYLSALANPKMDTDDFIYSDDGNTLLGLIAITRSLTNIYDTQLISDAMVGELVNVAYTEFANLRDWNSFSTYLQTSLDDFAPWSSVTPSGQEAHYGILKQTILSSFEVDDTKRLPRPKAVFVIDPDGNTKQAIFTDSLNLVVDEDDKIYYTISKDSLLNQISICLAPEQRPGSTLRVLEYSPTGRLVNQAVVDGETTYYFISVSEIPGQFGMLIPYRAAQFVLMQVSPDDSRIDMFANMYTTIVDAFVTYDQLSHDTRTFALGERGKDDPRYVPWFRPS